MAKILVVEDDLDLCEMTVEWLGFEHHTVEAVHNGRQGYEHLQSYAYDLVILDWDLPEMAGIEICSKYRLSGGSTPIIMLTGKGAIKEKETGLDAGADDYLTKPFHMKELSARIRALLRRPQALTTNVLKAGDISLEPSTYHVTKGGIEIGLLPKEFAMLEFLMRHPGQVFSAEALLDRVWKADSDASPDAIRTCLKRLRKKIDGADGTSVIRTVHGVGYKLEP